MGKLQLEIKADLEHIAKLTPTIDTRWYFKMRCTHCGEDCGDKWNYITAECKSEISGSRGDANWVSKCKNCKRENSIDLVEDQGTSYTQENSSHWQPIAIFDCRGCEMYKFDPRKGFVAEGEKGTQFEVDFSEGDWVEFDEKIGESVGIYNLESRFEKHK